MFADFKIDLAAVTFVVEHNEIKAIKSDASRRFMWVFFL